MNASRQLYLFYFRISELLQTVKQMLISITIMRSLIDVFDKWKYFIKVHDAVEVLNDCEERNIWRLIVEESRG